MFFFLGFVVSPKFHNDGIVCYQFLFNTFTVQASLAAIYHSPKNPILPTLNTKPHTRLLIRKKELH